MKTNKKVLIVGAGKSGIACAKLLIRNGFEVLISDREKREETSQELPSKISLINEGEAAQKANIFSFAVKSPGIEESNIVISSLNKSGIPVKSELETALSFSKTSKVIMITGTNGKTTTATLCGKIMNGFMKKKGAKAFVCGNIGYPVSLAVMKATSKDALVIEVSSYQLADSYTVKPTVSSILNITPDHIEHHGSMKAYISAKKSIFLSQSKKDFCVLNYEDKILRKASISCPSKILFFSSKSLIKKDGAFLENGKIAIKFGGEKTLLNPPSIPGIHNMENAMASALCSIACGADVKSVQEAFASFKGIEHRIEFVRKINGVSYYNDSKATNVDSTVIALKALGKTKNIWLILGGRDKKAPYNPLFPLVKKYVKKILTVGEAAEIIEKAFMGKAEIINCDNIFNAIDTVNKNAQFGDIALLSPACASYDQFSNFEERGKKFKNYVLSIEKNT